MATDVGADAMLKYTLEGLLDQQQCMNVWHFRTKVASTLEDIEDELNNNLLGDLADIVSNEFQWTRAAIQQIYPTLSDPYEEGKSFNGAMTGASLPVANAAVIAMKTGTGGRKNRGRKYIAGVPATSVDNSRLVSDYQTLAQNTFNTMNARYKSDGTANIVWGIHSNTLSTGGPGHFFRDVNSIIVRPVLGTMRSRLPGHGR